MRWPPKTPKKQKYTKKRERKEAKKTKIPKKELFSYQLNFSFCGSQNFPFLTIWPKTSALPKHYKNKGFREQNFEKQLCVTKWQFLDPKNPNPEIPVIIVFVRFLLFHQQKRNNALKPLFYSKVKKNMFQKVVSKHRKLKNPIFAPFFLKKAIFRKVPDNWTKNKNT